MRNLLYITILSISLGSCGGGGGDDPTPPPVVNTAPTVPILEYPTDNLLCLDNLVTHTWKASTDKENNTITYQIEVAKDAQFTVNKQVFTTILLQINIALESNFAYYWRMKASDGDKESSYSSTFKFYTYGVGITNQLPFTPEVDSPKLNSSVSTAPTVNLQWTATDANTTDVLTFDVYLGTNETILENEDGLYDTELASLLLKEPVNQDDTNKNLYKITNVTASLSTKYYWKVVVKDNKGGQTIGQVWSFTTD
jgi:hypothetical protein